MKISSPIALVFTLLLPSWAVAAQDLKTVVTHSAYRTNSTSAAEADQDFSRAMEIFESHFTKGKVQEFREKLNNAGILGHEGATDMLCTFNSNEALGIAFFRQAYFWCRVAEVNFSERDPEKAERAKESLAFVSKQLGSKNLYSGEEYEQFMLKKMADAANTANESK